MFDLIKYINCFYIQNQNIATYVYIFCITTQDNQANFQQQNSIIDDPFILFPGKKI